MTQQTLQVTLHYHPIRKELSTSLIKHIKYLYFYCLFSKKEDYLGLRSKQKSYQPVDAKFTRGDMNISIHLETDTATIYQYVTISKNGIEVRYRMEGFKPIEDGEDINFKVQEIKVSDANGDKLEALLTTEKENALTFDIGGSHYNTALLTPADKETLLGTMRFSLKNMLFGTNLYYKRKTVLNHLYNILQSMEPNNVRIKELAPKYLLGNS